MHEAENESGAGGLAKDDRQFSIQFLDLCVPVTSETSDYWRLEKYPRRRYSIAGETGSPGKAKVLIQI